MSEPYERAEVYDTDGRCFRCEGVVKVSKRYGPWCMKHNIERIRRVNAGFDAILKRFESRETGEEG